MPFEQILNNCLPHEMTHTLTSPRRHRQSVCMGICPTLVPEPIMLSLCLLCLLGSGASWGWNLGVLPCYAYWLRTYKPSRTDCILAWFTHLLVPWSWKLAPRVVCFISQGLATLLIFYGAFSSRALPVGQVIAPLGLGWCLNPYLDFSYPWQSTQNTVIDVNSNLCLPPYIQCPQFISQEELPGHKFLD